MTVKIGDQFRSTYADANCLWEVTAPAGRGMWRCETQPEYVTIRGRKVEAGYAGVVQGFTTDYIERSMALARSFENLMDDHERFYSQLPIGSVVHYDNGFGQFVRCVRVKGPKRKRLQPIALVGNWDAVMDLPRLEPDGSIHEGYHVEQIRKGARMEPNVSLIWEAMDAKSREYSMRGLSPDGTPPEYLNEIGRARYAEKRYQSPFDPTVEPAIDLTPPSMTAEQERVAMLVRKVAYIYHLCGERPEEGTAEAYEAILDRVREEVAK